MHRDLPGNHYALRLSQVPGDVGHIPRLMRIVGIRFMAQLSKRGSLAIVESSLA
jgi:hypothetical protein